MEVFLQHQHLVKVQPEWWHELTEKIKINKKATEDLALDVSVPLNYYAVFHTLQSMMPRDAIIVSEGANTMVSMYSNISFKYIIFLLLIFKNHLLD